MSKRDEARAEKLRSLQAALRENEELKAQITILRNALEPFASMGKAVLDAGNSEHILPDTFFTGWYGVLIYQRDIFRATTAMSSTDPATLYGVYAFYQKEFGRMNAALVERKMWDDTIAAAKKARLSRKVKTRRKA